MLGERTTASLDISSQVETLKFCMCCPSQPRFNWAGSCWECRQIHTSHVIFLIHITRVFKMYNHTSWLKCLHARVTPSSCHPWWAVERLFLVVSSFWQSPCVSPLPCSSLPTSTSTLSWTSSSMRTTPRQTYPASPPTEGSCSLPIYHPPTTYEPNVLDDIDYSETSAMFFQDESGDIDTEPSYLCDAELDDETIGIALSSPLFIQERKEPANLRQAYLSWRKFVASSVIFRTHQNGETRFRT